MGWKRKEGVGWEERREEKGREGGTEEGKERRKRGRKAEGRKGGREEGRKRRVCYNSCINILQVNFSVFLLLQKSWNGSFVITCAVPNTSLNLCLPKVPCAPIPAKTWATLTTGAVCNVMVASVPPWGITLTRQRVEHPGSTICTLTSLHPTLVSSRCVLRV